jgi:hypothetical protein
MSQDDAIAIATAFIKESGLGPYGDIVRIGLIVDLPSGPIASSGETGISPEEISKLKERHGVRKVWFVGFDTNMGREQVSRPDAIFVDIDDETGEARLFKTL